MKKFCLDLTVKSVEHINEKYVLLKLTDENPLPEMIPGQFVEIQVDGSKTTFLRRPISINDVDREDNTLHLLIACIGDGTRQLGTLSVGSKVNIMLPLGNGFTMPESSDKKHLLVGGGVGVAPLMYLGRKIKEMGGEPTFLLGARSKKDLLLIDEFKEIGRVFITTEDGTEGEKGFVTNHSVLSSETFDMISTCGPKPMMMAVARFAAKAGVECEVSLENKMACGVGACLCCVEDTLDGHVCVCKEGPVINIKKLKWQI
jgi:dihydroorotate dehydrogenase electron transfer subunit